MTKILCFDKWSKCELFKKYYGRKVESEIIYSFDLNEAIEIIKTKQPKIILLGGDVDTDELKSVQLYNRMNEWDLIRKKIIYISTWNTDEARILRDMDKRMMYCPFSESLANIVKERAKILNYQKRAKELEIRRKQRE